MKNILCGCFLTFMLLTFGCRKKSTPNPNPEQDSIKLVHAAIQGRWDYVRLDEKSILKSSGGGVVLNPDGTPVDTVRKTYDLSDSYFEFKQSTLTVYENRNNNGFGFQNKPYEVIFFGRRIQANELEPYEILELTSKKMVLTEKKVSVGNQHYTEYYYTYNLKK